jgi:membrane associated rhomboid family serine protease
MRQRNYLKPGGTPPRGVRLLLIGYTVAMVTFVFWGSRLYPDGLALIPSKVIGGLELWRILSTLIYFGSLDQIYIAPFLLGMTALWLLGTPLELWLGFRRFLILFFTSAVVGHLVATLVGLALASAQPVGDASPGVWGVLTAVGLIYWREQVFVLRPVPLQGKHVLLALMAAFAVAVIYDLATGFALLPKAATLVGAGVGALFVTRSWRPSLLFGGSGPKTRFVMLQGGRATESFKSGKPKGTNGGTNGGSSGRGSGDSTPPPPKNLWN